MAGNGRWFRSTRHRDAGDSLWPDGARDQERIAAAGPTITCGELANAAYPSICKRPVKAQSR